MPNIVIVHPDLGIGGAERLIVDAALALQKKKHKVVIYTSHHDPNHCFHETIDGSIPVYVYGDWMPRTIFGYGYVVCAFIRMLYVALCILCDRHVTADVIICDQVSIHIPILKLKCSHIIFYCHFPDQLLSKPGGWLKKIYRAPINILEENTTGKASTVIVNSQFTLSVFKDTFKRITVDPYVLYPSVPIEKFDTVPIEPINDIFSKCLPSESFIFLSINRYERKKNIGLAIQSFVELRCLLNEAEWEKCHLIIAGGYDELVSENITYFNDLSNLVWSHCMENKVTMLKSPSEQLKVNLIRFSTCLLYTPSNEHFGIVPLEAMYLQTPVIAVNSGGPTETVVDGTTGFLREPSSKKFASAMSFIVKNPKLTCEMGRAGKERVLEHFSFDEFAQRLDSHVQQLLNNRNNIESKEKHM